MNAINFIKQHCVEKAREVLSGAPEWAIFWITQGEYHISTLSFPNMTDHYSVDLVELKRLVESVDVVKQLDFWGRADVGIKKAKEVIKNNTLQASYYQPSSGCYYRYGRNSLYIVRDGEWREIYVGMDSNTLIHTDSLKQAIADYESIYCVADMGDDTHIENHVSPNCKVGVK